MQINKIKTHKYKGLTIYRIEEIHENYAHYKWAVATDEYIFSSKQIARTHWHLFQTKPMAQQFIDNFCHTSYTLGA